MKRTICLFSLLIVRLACAQEFLVSHKWTVTLKVVNEDGQPVAGAKAGVGNGISNFDISGLTDTNGFFVATHYDASDNLAFYAEKSGYYSFQMTYNKGDYDQSRWNPVQTIFLKRIIKPIPMYAKTLNTHVPALDKPIGFDLMAGDWIAPYGKGGQSDILFTAHFDKPDNNESDFKLTVSFPNQGDGIQEFKAPLYYLHSSGSALRSVEVAPTNNYLREWVQFDNRKSGQTVKTNRDLERNYYFRVRTILDENGNVKSTLYGKIYGDFMYFKYYLNPTPNSRSVEFDTKQNLIKNLKSFEEVRDP